MVTPDTLRFLFLTYQGTAFPLLTPLHAIFLCFDLHSDKYVLVLVAEYSILSMQVLYLVCVTLYNTLFLFSVLCISGICTYYVYGNMRFHCVGMCICMVYTCPYVCVCCVLYVCIY